MKRKIKIVRADRPDDSKPAFTRRRPIGWPLRFNPSMDEHAAHFGFSHWSCVETNSNQFWLRRDGQAVRVDFKGQGGYLDDLRKFDRLFPFIKPAQIFR